MPDAVLDDLRDRISRTRWPGQVPGIGWEQGTELAYLRRTLAYWAGGFDWPAQEAYLNGFPHFTTVIDGCRIHFVHVRSARPGALPLVLTHGWPSSFVELLPLVPLLPDFDLVIPSLPGYGFSERPARTGVNYRVVAGLWHRLMTGLGYERYGAHGGDFGSGVAALLGLDHPGSVVGIHLTNVDIPPAVEPPEPYRSANAAWSSVERGYSAIQSTKPQTLGYALNDSPAGLAAWILEKWRSWTDSGGDLDTAFDRDFLLTTVTLYWVTQTITSSMRDYWDNRWHAVPVDESTYVDVPTAIALFEHQYVPEGEPPREWLERMYRVERFTRMPRGGHFAPVEAPELVADDIRAFFTDVARRRSTGAASPP